MKNLDWMQEALENMDIAEMINALENMSNNMDRMERELDRFLDIFERVKAEQKIDEVRKRLKELVKNQDNLDRQIRSTEKDTDSSIFKRLSQEQKLVQKELENIFKEIDLSIDPIKSLVEKLPRALKTLAKALR